MPDRLKLTQNAQFFISKNVITDISILEILDAAKENRDVIEDFIINEFRTEQNITAYKLQYKYSVIVFLTQRPVYFIEDGFFDKVYAFILIIEIGNYLAIFKKSCANIEDTAERNFNKISSSQLWATFDDDKVSFQKISLRNMSIYDKALRSRSYEAQDLKGILSTHAAGRSIPYFLKIKQDSNNKSISSTGRLVESVERKCLEDIAIWSQNQINLIQNPAKNKDFIGSFAKLVDLQQVLANTEPSAILIESSLLYDHLISTKTPLKYKNQKGRIFTLSKRRIANLFEKLGIVYEVNNTLEIIGFENSSRLKKNSKSISFASEILQRIKVIEKGKEISLQKCIISNGFFSICFNDPKFMYFMGHCFEDTSGISEIPNILKILAPKPAFLTVTSEKGSLREESTEFDTTSIFSHVEKLQVDDDYIFCDDLGDEWADHITLNKDDSCISFLHSKHGESSKSASNQHNVVGQGIKNLGNMYFDKNRFMKKNRTKFSKNYSNENIKSNLKRLRKGDSSSLDSYLVSLLKDYSLHRKCILCCSFISKKEITAEFNKIKAGKIVRGNIVQLLWIISSFAHAAKEMHIIPLIYCKP